MACILRLYPNTLGCAPKRNRIRRLQSKGEWPSGAASGWTNSGGAAQGPPPRQAKTGLAEEPRAELLSLEKESVSAQAERPLSNAKAGDSTHTRSYRKIIYNCVVVGPVVCFRYSGIVDSCSNIPAYWLFGSLDRWVRLKIERVFAGRIYGFVAN